MVMVSAGCGFNASGLVSPLQTQHFTPSLPYMVFASAKP